MRSVSAMPAAKIHHVVIAALRSVLKAVVAEPVLQQNPRRLTAQTEAIAQAGGSAQADGIEGVKAIPYVAAQISAEIQSQITRKLETIATLISLLHAQSSRTSAERSEFERLLS